MAEHDFSDYDRKALELLSRYAISSRLARMDEILSERTRYVTGVFENMYQAHNIHAAMRSLECQGIQDLYVIDDFQAFTRNTSVTKGAGYWLDIHTYRSSANSTATDRCVADLRARGYRLYAADFAQEAYTPETVPLDAPIAVVMGAEQAGVSPQIKRQVDGIIMIPMSGFTQSYNVSVAVGIIMYILTRRIIQEVGPSSRLTIAQQSALKLHWLRQEIRGARALEQRYLVP
jgi:tRNA (guanosine-2'-O-)-methyltransferase